MNSCSYGYNNPVRLIDPDGMKADDWRDKKGNLVYDAKKGGYTSYATADHKRFGNSLLKISAGRNQFNKLVNSSIPITTEISSGKGPSTGTLYTTGNTTTFSNINTNVATKAEIVIYEGRITDFMNVINNYYKAGNENKLSEQEQLYHDNTTTIDKKIAAVAGHEIEHATSEENRKLDGDDKETSPEAIETEILKQTPSSRPIDLKPFKTLPLTTN